MNREALFHQSHNLISNPDARKLCPSQYDESPRQQQNQQGKEQGYSATAFLEFKRES
jgi:hypothetical protein